VLEPPPDQHRLEPHANRLDLGQLRHAANVVACGGEAAAVYDCDQVAVGDLVAAFQPMVSRMIGRARGISSPSS
jgi:hypothetical protein